MRIAYTRVSSRDQNPDMQHQLLKNAGFDKLYTEKRTGTKSLPELEKCINDIRENDTLIVYRLDRLGRTVRAIVQAVYTISQKGAVIISVSEKIDTSTPGGRAMVNMIALLAEYEHDLIVERCDDGREAARNRGVKFGRPEGSRNNEASGSSVTLYKAGHSISDIQKSLNIKSRSTVYQYLKAAGVLPDRKAFKTK